MLDSRQTFAGQIGCQHCLGKDRVREAVLRLIEKGFRIEPRLLARVLKEIESFDLQHKL